MNINFLPLKRSSMNKLRNVLFLGCLTAVVVFLYCCNNSKGNDLGPPYDPGKPIECESFYPAVGGMATQVILVGKNFGNDPKAIEVMFNDKPASVIGCSSERILVVTPRRPGEECTISVKIGDSPAKEFPQKYQYEIRAVVSTIVGKKGTNEIIEGSFADAQFRNPCYITIDSLNNLFIVEQDNGHQVLMASMNEMYVRKLADCGNKPNAPTTDITGKLILVPADGGSAAWNEVYWEFNSDDGYTSKSRIITHPTIAEIANGEKNDFTLQSYKHSFAICAYDSMVYYRSNQNGAIIRYNPYTREGERALAYNTGEEIWCRQGVNGDGFLVNDPFEPSRMYVSLSGGGGNHSVILYFDVKTGENGIFAGVEGNGVKGWRDGPVLDARFAAPKQAVLDADGNLLIADSENHCIRQIDLKTKMVTTLVGIAGKADLIDGNKDDACFNGPWGLAIDRKDGTVYICDRGNKVIRMLTIE